MCVSIFSTIFVWNISHFKEKLARYIDLHRSSCKVLVTLVRFSWNWNIFWYILEMYSVSSFMKIRPVGAELFYTVGHYEANSRFPQLWKRAPKKCIMQVGKCNNICYIIAIQYAQDKVVCYVLDLKICHFVAFQYVIFLSPSAVTLQQWRHIRRSIGRYFYYLI